MHSRDIGVAECFERTVDGFIAFILYLGDVPCGMERPTVGRIDHDRGYELGNFTWQSMSENSKEVRVRKPASAQEMNKENSRRLELDPEFREMRRRVGARNLNQGPNRSRHNRWHVKRGIRKEGCPFCEETKAP